VVAGKLGKHWSPAQISRWLRRRYRRRPAGTYAPRHLRGGLPGPGSPGEYPGPVRAGRCYAWIARQVHARSTCATRRSFICPAKRGEIGGISLDPMAYPGRKANPGDNSMPGNQRSCPGVRGDALGDLHDMAKAVLPEA